VRLALFDLDNTLLSGDSDVEWLSFLIEEGAVPASEAAANEDMARRYADGSVSVLEFVRFYLRFYPSHPAARLHAWRTKFVENKIAPRIPLAARQLVDSHRGDLSVIITATNRFLTEPIAALLGVPHLIATEPEMRDGCFTGEVAGTPCMREGKIERLRAWLKARGASLSDYPESWFYSDSINDLPLLLHVTRPVVVDPDPRLAAEAERRGWRRISLRA
jgi:HAD superfamily hydrolase (TIGR01490 family)